MIFRFAPFLFIIASFLLSATTAKAQGFVRIADEAPFELTRIPDGYKTLPAPECIPKEVLTRYPDTVAKLLIRVSCANARMNARVYEEQINAMDESLRVIATNRMLLEKSLEKLNKVKALEQLGEGVVMPVGVRTDRYHIGAIFSAKCAVPPDASFGSGEPIGERTPKFKKTDPIFAATTKKLQKILTEELPTLFGTLGELIAEEKPSKSSITYYAIRVGLTLSPFMVVGREFFDEAFPRQKPTLTAEMTVSDEKKCPKKGHKFYAIRLGNKILKACFDPGNVPIKGNLVEVIKKKIQENLDELDKERQVFEKEKHRYEMELAFLRKNKQQCF